MKKAVGIFFGLFILMYCLSMTCFAAENVHETAVNAKYHSSEIEIYQSSVKCGTAELSLQNGIAFSVKLNKKYNGYTFVVRPVTQKDKEAFDWFKSFVSSDVSDFMAYEIYLLDTQKEKLKLPDNTEIKIKLCNSNYTVNGISCESKQYEIKSDVKNGVLKFNSIKQADYYLIQRKPSTSVCKPIQAMILCGQVILLAVVVGYLARHLI